MTQAFRFAPVALLALVCSFSATAADPLSAPIGSDLVALSIESLSNRYGLNCDTQAPKIKCSQDRDGVANRCLLKQKTTCVPSDKSIFPKKSKVKIKVSYATRTYSESGEFRIHKIKIHTTGPNFDSDSNEIFGSSFETETLSFLSRSHFDCDTSAEWKSNLKLFWTRKLSCDQQADPVSPKTELTVRLLRTRGSLRSMSFVYKDPHLDPHQDAHPDQASQD